MVPTPPLPDEPGLRSALTGPPAPEVSEDEVEEDHADALGGRHRLLGRGWLTYSLWVLTPLAIALAIAGISALPGQHLPPYAGDLPGLRPDGVPPTPAPAPSTSPSRTTGPTGAAVVTTRPTGSPEPVPGASSSQPATAAPSPSFTQVQPALFLSLEAEAGALGRDLRVVALAGASGGSVVTGLGSQAKTQLVFPAVVVLLPREYHLRFWYAASVDTDLRLDSSAGTSATVYCPSTGSGATIGWYDTVVLLGTGTNSITVGGDRAGGLDLDRITLW